MQMLTLVKYDLGMMYSDFVVALACVFSFIITKQKPAFKGGFAAYWRAFFLFEGISFVIGGLAHGLVTGFNRVLDMLGWACSIFAFLLFAIGALRVVLQQKNRLLEISLHAVAVIAAYVLIRYYQFSVVIIYCFIILFLVILINEKRKFISFKYPHTKGIIIGALLFVLASMFFVFNIVVFSLAAGITAHYIIAAGVICFGFGCKATIAYETANMAGATAYAAGNQPALTK